MVILRCLTAAVLASACAAPHGDEGTAGPAVIFGQDDRREVFESDDFWREKASSVALVVSTEFLDPVPGGFELFIKSLAEANACPDVPFREQPASYGGSGFLVGPDLFVTAAHLIGNQWSCDHAAIVFDYGYFSKGQGTEIHKGIRRENVFSCKEIIASIEERHGADFALIRLDRSVPGRTPLMLRRSGTPLAGAEITLLGHPTGLPLKVDGGDSRIRAFDPSLPYFVVETDSFAGNSGSPVLNRETGEVEGVFVRGEADFRTEGACDALVRCEAGGCRGEEVTKSSEILARIPTALGI